MHIPDGFLSNRLAVSLDAVSAVTILYSARRAQFDASGRMIPTMGVLAAFVFAAQMLNFPVLGGTSGHLVGGTVLGVLLGPMAGFLTMAAVIIAQALFMQDGGLIALGANIFNIGAITVFAGYATFRLLGGGRSTGRRLAVAAFLAGWLSLVLSASCCALELALSGTIALRVGLPAMAGYHALIGIAEGGLTAGILSFLTRVRPDLMSARGRYRFGIVDWVGALVLVALPFMIFALAGSSSLPDPLQALLAGTGAESGAATALDSQTLLSPARYLDYIWRAVLFLLFMAIAYAVVRLTRGRSKRA